MVHNDCSFTGHDDALDASIRHAAAGEERRDEYQLLTIQEVAELLRVPVSWVYERVRKRSLGRLPAYRLGKYWRFREADIHAWIERQRTGGGSNA